MHLLVDPRDLPGSTAVSDRPSRGCQGTDPIERRGGCGLLGAFVDVNHLGRTVSRATAYRILAKSAA
ncbi:hypothetical protein MAIC_36920 [Mycolicibacterium aichiense]|uniref:Uncharacterized protein n=1 Tax=Mycolicibacterium aichiense TaxID=1799 RepID=A0AAD1HQ51_9MYCO|nr:hypothetical protein MAIC_36920 [Mycolicibacterium aichiense]STZ82682.1 Uncharacterised protein [Mycolicibacterium aichiense]